MYIFVFMFTEPNKTLVPPSLSPDLTQLYSLLNSDARRLFNRVYFWLWRYLLNKRAYLSRSAILYYYWAINQLRINADLTTSELALLSFVYQVSDKGTKPVHSKVVYNGIFPDYVRHTKIVIICNLINRGYLCRSPKDPDPARKYYSIPWPPHPVWISLTPSGVMLIRGIESKLYDIVLHSSLDDITGKNKKG